MNFQKLESEIAQYYKETMQKLLTRRQHARANQMVAHMTALKKELTWIERYGDEIDDKIDTEKSGE